VHGRREEGKGKEGPRNRRQRRAGAKIVHSQAVSALPIFPSPAHRVEWSTSPHQVAVCTWSSYCPQTHPVRCCSVLFNSVKWPLQILHLRVMAVFTSRTRASSRSVVTCVVVSSLNSCHGIHLPHPFVLKQVTWLLPVNLYTNSTIPSLHLNLLSSLVRTRSHRGRRRSGWMGSPRSLS
jgi:hypothetical protein